MKIKNVDFMAKRIRVMGKSGTRFIVFGEPASKALRAYLGKTRDDFLFTDGKPFQRLRVYASSFGGGAVDVIARTKPFDGEFNQRCREVSRVNPRNHRRRSGQQLERRFCAAPQL